MFRSSTIIRELVLSLAKVMSERSVKLFLYRLCGSVAACLGVACVLCAVQNGTESRLLLCLCILIVMYALFCIFCFHRANWHSPTTLTEVFFRAFSSALRQMPGYTSHKTGHGQHSSKLVNCAVLCVVCV
jgi:hypothetical protein